MNLTFDLTLTWHVTWKDLFLKLLKSTHRELSIAASLRPPVCELDRGRGGGRICPLPTRQVRPNGRAGLVLRRQGSNNAKNSLAKNANNFWTEKVSCIIWALVFLSSRHGESYAYLVTLNGQVNIWPQVEVTWVHILTQVGHVAYKSMRLDKTNTMSSCPCL